jgi:hypothetical protein
MTAAVTKAPASPSGRQVERRRCFFLTARVESPSVRLPVLGALAVEPGEEVVPADQVRHDRGAAITQQ